MMVTHGARARIRRPPSRRDRNRMVIVDFAVRHRQDAVVLIAEAASYPPT